MHKLRTVTAAAALATGLVGGALAQDAGTVVARVGAQEITLGHMIALRERLPQQYQQLDDQTLWDGVLDQLIQQTALAETVSEPGKRVSLTLENERRALLSSQVIDEHASAAVTEEALKAAYDAAYAGAEPGQEYNASHILVETEEEAQTLIQQLNDGADFAELARENSTGPSGPSGGELGWFGPGAMVPAFDEAVQDMEVGEVAGPIQTQFGWHVVKLNDSRQKDAPPLEEVRAELEAQIQNEAVGALIAEAVAAVEVKRPAEGEIDPAALRDDSLLDR